MHGQHLLNDWFQNSGSRQDHHVYKDSFQCSGPTGCTCPLRRLPHILTRLSPTLFPLSHHLPLSLFLSLIFVTKRIHSYQPSTSLIFLWKGQSGSPSLSSFLIKIGLFWVFFHWRTWPRWQPDHTEPFTFCLPWLTWHYKNPWPSWFSKNFQHNWP